MESRSDVRLLMTRYTMTCELQAEHTLLASTNNTVGESLARWLLMDHDRVQGDEFPATHQLLAIMLNVRRADVTSAMHVLEGEHAIRASRWAIHVTDREGLIGMEGGSYGILKSTTNG